MLLLTGALMACEGPQANPPPTNDTAENHASLIPGRRCEDTSLTWENFGEGFMLSHCAGCHSSTLPEGERANATVGVDLERHDLVIEHIQRTYVNAADENTVMPPVANIDPEDRWLLGDWLACGAP